MRSTLATLVMLAWPMVASAQSTLAPLPPLPPIGLPLPQITSPLTPIALTPPDARPQPDARARPRPRFDGRHRPTFQWPVIYFVDRYSFPIATEVTAPIVSDSWMGSSSERPAADASVRAPAAPAAEPEPEPEPQTAAATAPPPPSTFYYIPDCYIGNVPPSEVVLPANCDRTRLIVRTP